MELVAIVISLALLQYSVFGMLVGKARGTYEIKAPAISGHPIFERYYRVHMNTLEQLTVFIPAILIFGYFGNAAVAAGLGLVFLVGRVMFLLGYVKDPAWPRLPNRLYPHNRLANWRTRLCCAGGIVKGRELSRGLAAA